ncbi:MAG TPA: hypothetical protein VGG89_01245 [Candidatus Baltobacteraceae bacterium]|jgi:hypothetical protein
MAAMWKLLKRPEGFLPLLISAGFLAALLTSLAQGTLARESDEGTAAHVFQILMPLQLAIVLFFAIRWLPGKTKAALQVLALQCGAAIAVLAIVYVKQL